MRLEATGTVSVMSTHHSPGAHVVTVSDRCHAGVRSDASGPAAVAALEASGYAVTSSVVPDGEASVADALRAALLRLLGYRVDVVEFVGSEHTARNVLLRAVRTGAAPTPALVAQYQQLTAAWGLQPHLAGLLGAELADVLG